MAELSNSVERSECMNDVYAQGVLELTDVPYSLQDQCKRRL